MERNYKAKVGDTFTSSSTSYEVQSILGYGTFGQVTLCHKASTRQMVALKVLRDPDHDDEGEQEARILQMLQEKDSRSHHIIQWMGSFVDRGLYCHEFEKLDIDLRTFLETCPYESLQLEHIRPIITQTARALAFLKANGIIHCDLKSDNIMLINRLDQPFRIKLIDFGSACHVSEAQRGDLVGTFYYRAPEVQVGAAMTEAIDIWSLGCMAAEMLLGRFLFEAENPYDLMRHTVQIVGQPPKQVLDSGIRTRKFFQKPKQSTDWVFISKQKKRPTPLTISRLDEIYERYPFNAEQTTSRAENQDCRLFVDLLKRMLDLDPMSRVTPEDILNHPFNTMTHLRNFPLYHFNSHEILKQVMNVSEEEEQQSSSTSSTKMSEEGDTSVATEAQTSSQKRKREKEEEAPRKRLRIDTSRSSQTENETTKKRLKVDDTILQKREISSSQESKKENGPSRKMKQRNDYEEKQQTLSTSSFQISEASGTMKKSPRKRSREEKEEAPQKRLRKEEDTSRNSQAEDKTPKKWSKEDDAALQNSCREGMSSLQQYKKEKEPSRKMRQRNDGEEKQQTFCTSSIQISEASGTTEVKQGQNYSQKRGREEKEEVQRKRLRKEDAVTGKSSRGRPKTI